MASASSILGIAEILVPRFKTAPDGSSTADGNNLYYFQTSKIYADKSVADACGLTFIAIEDWRGGEPLVSVAELIRSGKLQRYYAQCLGKDSAGNDISKSVAIFCIPDKVTTVVGPKSTLLNKDLKRTVKGASVTIGKVYNVRQKAKDAFI